jgi:hypothetical protein
MTVVKSIEDQFGAQVRRHRPADHPPTPDIQHDREEQEAGCGRDEVMLATNRVRVDERPADIIKKARAPRSLV